ncbi:16S rRNA (cytosine(967)-C(5))-methyltransferase RsmB [Psychrosphaera ytuae]|uniref:16S rRNA (cytosine(967)-C(5))-methyltransferase n=1 Tax=Psychrosphaera ytuae TaxID=2820710 RepID=A0A975HHB4_9GAMM|nr:16S rRNA (cytosine(967)-C(5))-methyltransferase RsmB [Psychrosphaera ytuae]QTH63001.1 16S rRNA (cytosine(967)-C(5))-methyltransferase RsmB [Psychrosphaera ytuae]
MKATNVRAKAAEVLLAVMDKGQSLSEALPNAQKQISSKDHALLQEMCFGAIRLFPRFDAITNQLLSKKMKGKQRVFHHLIIIGLYQIEEMRIPEHASVAETVQAAVALKASGLKGLINACLRNYMRNKDAILKKINNDVVEYCHPNWFIKRIQAAYPTQWQAILANNLKRSPMWLRVHTNNCALDQFVSELKQHEIGCTQPLPSETAILLDKPMPVEKIPGFEQGWFTVQDGAAQHAALLLEPKDGDVILDACAAPGGKTLHILDMAETSVTAADIDESRLDRVRENLARLGETASVICGDLTLSQTIGDREFDRILLDAPCSATGVIRRHPDIKWLRRSEDIDNLATVQKQILQTLWGKLKPGGTLLYATCSILPSENVDLMREFLASTDNAELSLIDHPLNQSESAENPGWQIFPGEHNMDGFYYCRIKKQQ